LAATGVGRKCFQLHATYSAERDAKSSYTTRTTPTERQPWRKELVAMKYSILREDEVVELDALSRSLGNVPFLPNQCSASILRDKGEIIGFAAVQAAVHAAGSWIKEDYRGKKYTYTLRKMLEDNLRSQGIKVYFAIPGNDIEKMLFAKYGPVTEKLVQVKEV
jgi:hypothetical protein